MLTIIKTLYVCIYFCHIVIIIICTLRVRQVDTSRVNVCNSNILRSVLLP